MQPLMVALLKIFKKMSSFFHQMCNQIIQKFFHEITYYFVLQIL